MTEFEIHPAAEYFGFPMMEGQEWEEHLASIQKLGQVEPATLFEGKLADGRNRYKACKELGLELKTEEYKGKPEDLLDFIWAKNFSRRHLNDSQKACAAALRATAGRGDFFGNQYQVVSTLNVDTTTSEAIPPKKTIDQVAQEAGVATSTVAKAKRALKGNKAVFKAIKDGLISTEASEQIMKLPTKEEQAAALEAAIAKGFGKKHANRKSATKEPKPKRKSLFEQWKELNPEKWARVNDTSVPFPGNDLIPQGDTADEKSVREGIEQLHKNEVDLPTYGKLQLDNLIYPFTQRIQTFIINRDHHPRPEGNLGGKDGPYWKWARHVAARMINFQNFYNFRYLEQKKKKPKAKPVNEPKPVKDAMFELRFKELWQATRPIVVKFPISDLEKIKQHWNDQLDNYFQTRQHNADAKLKPQTAQK